MEHNVAYAGAQFTIEFAQLSDGSMPAKVFLSEQKPQFQARLFALFKHLGDNGRISNREHFKKLKGDFWEFKNFQIRMPCYFQPGRRVVITHGFLKKKDSLDRRELKRAEDIKTEYERIRSPRSEKE